MNLLEAALRYAEHGWPVVPLHHPEEGEDKALQCSCRREGCSSPAKHPRTLNGVHDATTDEARIREWWGMWPEANVGIACGHGVVMVDVDGPDAERQLQELQGKHGQLPATMTVHTGRQDGGRHLYYLAPIGAAPHDLAPGLEVRGLGRYVVGAPSRHITGRYYTTVDQADPVEAPAWLLETRGRENGAAGAQPIGDRIPKGQQHKTLVSLAGTMRRRGMNADEILGALTVVNRRLEEPAPEKNLRDIAESVARYKPGSKDANDYQVELDGKGEPTLPPQPAAGDHQALCAWLTGVFGLGPQHPIIGGEYQGRRGSVGHAVLRRLDAPSIRFEPASRINTPMRLIEDLTWQTVTGDRPVPGFKGKHCREIAYVVKQVCGAADGMSDEEETIGIVVTFMQSADRVDGYTTHGTSGQRYEAANALRKDVEGSGEHSSAPKYLVDTETGELVIRVSDLGHTSRQLIGGSIARGWLDARVQGIGWERVRLDGHALPGRQGRVGPHARADVYRGVLANPDADQTGDHVTTGDHDVSRELAA